jgi:hypothetical protein
MNLIRYGSATPFPNAVSNVVFMVLHALFRKGVDIKTCTLHDVICCQQRWRACAVQLCMPLSLDVCRIRGHLIGMSACPGGCYGVLHFQSG